MVAAVKSVVTGVVEKVKMAGVVLVVLMVLVILMTVSRVIVGRRLVGRPHVKLRAVGLLSLRLFLNVPAARVAACCRRRRRALAKIAPDAARRSCRRRHRALPRAAHGACPPPLAVALLGPLLHRQQHVLLLVGAVHPRRLGVVAIACDGPHCAGGTRRPPVIALFLARAARPAACCFSRHGDRGLDVGG